MTSEPDPFRPYRQPLLDTVRATINGLPFTQTELLHQQVGRIEAQAAGSLRWLPALVCLATADALGVNQRQAMAGACAIALLEATASLINELVVSQGDPEPEADSLIAHWGKPRTLNAADGFFALAHAALLELPAEGLSPEETLAATKLLDRGCTAWLEEAMQNLSKTNGATHSSSELLKLAVELGTALAGLSSADGAEISSFVAAPEGKSLSTPRISPEAKQSIKDLATNVGNFSKA